MASSMRVRVLSRTRPLRKPSTGTSTIVNTNAPSMRDRDREVGSSASSIWSVVRREVVAEGGEERSEYDDDESVQ